MIWDILIPLCAAVPILFGIWLGWTYGATLGMRHLLAHLFALLAAMWFWHPASTAIANAIKADPRIVVVLSFACVYGAAFSLASFAVALKAPAYRSVGSNPLDQILGALSGLATGAIGGGAIALLVTLLVPQNVKLSETALVAREWPARILRLTEGHLAGIPESSPERAQLPTVEFTTEPSGMPPDEQGMVFDRVIPKIIWK